MNESTPISSIRVKYKHVGEWHVFSSRDLIGLYVASTNAERAYGDVQVAIEKLLKLNSGIECKIEPELSFREFLALDRKRRMHIAPETTKSEPVMETRRYAVLACA